MSGTRSIRAAPLIDSPTSPQTLSITLQLWDAGGDVAQDEAAAASLLYGAHAVLFCYDISSYASFQNVCAVWLPTLQANFSPWNPPGR